jgi:uncharacterized protein YdeI (YjbR/CyaY-like superfamily)
VSALDEAPRIQFDDRKQWRAWLAENHATARGVWLVTWRPRSGRRGLDYEAAIEEALCFGGVDSTAGRVDEERGRLYFAPRTPRGAWAASNRARVARLIAAGRMAPAGLAAIERARANGSWDVLASAERLEVPDDLAEALASAGAVAAFAALAPSRRRQLLGWIALARRPATRADRIRTVVATSLGGLIGPPDSRA